MTVRRHNSTLGATSRSTTSAGSKTLSARFLEPTLRGMERLEGMVVVVAIEGPSHGPTATVLWIWNTFMRASMIMSPRILGPSLMGTSAIRMGEIVSWH